MVIIETERLILRHFHILDGAAMDRIFGDAEVMHYGDGVKTKEWVRAWLHDCLKHYSQWGFGMWAVVEKSRQQVIGYCGLSQFPERCAAHETEIGYRLARPYWGRGFATEAAHAVCHYGLDVLCLPRLIAMIDPGNVPSLRVAEKIGMRYEKDVIFEGWSHPDRLYVITRQSDP